MIFCTSQAMKQNVANSMGVSLEPNKQWSHYVSLNRTERSWGCYVRRDYKTATLMFLWLSYILVMAAKGFCICFEGHEGPIIRNNSTLVDASSGVTCSGTDVSFRLPLFFLSWYVWFYLWLSSQLLKSTVTLLHLYPCFLSIQDGPWESFKCT